MALTDLHIQVPLCLYVTLKIKTIQKHGNAMPCIILDHYIVRQKIESLNDAVYLVHDDPFTGGSITQQCLNPSAYTELFNPRKKKKKQDRYRD